MEEKEFTERCAVDAPFFINNILYKGRKALAPKQMELIASLKDHQHTVAIFNRQGGKTEALAGYDTQELAFGKTEAGDPVHIIVYAPIMQQTEIIMGRIHQFINNSTLLSGFLETQQKYHIKMRNGNTVTALSASDQSHVRGYSPTHIQIDETQDISDRMYYDDILPSGAATGAKIQETGTPKGRNHFFELTRVGKDTNIVYQHWEECPFIDREYVLKRKRHMPRAKFEAEFCCKFLTEWNVAFATQMLDGIIHLNPDDLPDQTYEAFYFGGDIGKQDETVLVVFGEADNQLWELDMRRLGAFESYKTVAHEISDLVDTYPITFGYMDMNGVGEGVVDLAIPEGAPIEGLWSENTSKQEMVDEFIVMGEGGAIEGFNPRIHLWNDYDLRQQFYEYEAKKLQSGRIRFHHPKGGNDDIVAAVLMGVLARRDDKVEVDYGENTGSSGLRSMGVDFGSGSPMDVLRGQNPYMRS